MKTRMSLFWRIQRHKRWRDIYFSSTGLWSLKDHLLYAKAATMISEWWRHFSHNPLVLQTMCFQVEFFSNDNWTRFLLSVVNFGAKRLNILTFRILRDRESESKWAINFPRTKLEISQSKTLKCWLCRRETCYLGKLKLRLYPPFSHGSRCPKLIPIIQCHFIRNEIHHFSIISPFFWGCQFVLGPINWAINDRPRHRLILRACQEREYNLLFANVGRKWEGTLVFPNETCNVND